MMRINSQCYFSYGFSVIVIVLIFFQLKLSYSYFFQLVTVFGFLSVFSYS